MMANSRNKRERGKNPAKIYNIEIDENKMQTPIFTRPKRVAIFALSLRHITCKSWAVQSCVDG
jgi:hypothetical protein